MIGASNSRQQRSRIFLRLILAVHRILQDPRLGAYLVNRTIVIPRTLTMRGFNMRNTSLRWAGSDAGANMLLLSGADTVDNVLLSDFAVDNQGSCGHAIWIATPQRVILERLFSSAERKFETAIVQTNTQLTVFDLVLRDCRFFVRSAAEVTPIGVGCATGHTHVIDHCMFSGFRTAVRIGNPDGPERFRRVDGFTMVNSRVETFGGNGAPGSPDAIGVDGVLVAGCHIAGNSFEMAGDQDPSSSAQRAIAIRTVLGGAIVGNYISGDGVLLSAIQFHNPS